jgi:hypothetical protein
MAFHWIPLQGPDKNAISRMRTHFAKPSKLAPVGWFISQEQDYHTVLSEQSPNVISLETLETILHDIANGISSFGAMSEWISWFKFLLPDLILRSHEKDATSMTLNIINTVFFNIYWERIPEDYPGFYWDTMESLGHCLMKPELWSTGDFSPQVDIRNRYSNSLSTSMLFCLKYLPIEDIAPWVGSIVNIPGDHWRQQINLSVTNLKLFYAAVLADRSIADSLEATQLDWYESSLLLRKPITTFISTERLEHFLSEIPRFPTFFDSLE